MHLRLSASICIGLVTSYSFGFIPFWVGSLALLALGLFIMPFLAYSDALINKVWGTSYGRFLASGRTMWLFLCLHTITWKEIVFCAIIQVSIDRLIMVLNYLLFHRTLLRNIQDSQWTLATEFSYPLNVVQLAGCEVLTALILRRFLDIHLPMLSLVALSMLTFWFERVIAQILVYVRHNDSEVGNARVFFTHWGPSADSGHWLLQVEGFIFHIFKRDGQVTARIERPQRPVDKRDDNPIPSLSQAVYVPFWQYGIVGLTDEAGSSTTVDQWRGFVEDCMDHYSSVNRSCQEFVIFSMYNLCHPPFFNMSDLKSLGPLAIFFTVIYFDMVIKAGFHIAAAFPGEIFF